MLKNATAVHSVELSVIVPFGDHEDTIGAACRRIAEHLRQQQLSFEILAVDEASTDNSHAILALLRRELPEVRISAAPGVGRGYAVGADQARGHALLLLEPESAITSLAAVGRAIRRVLRGELDLAVVPGRFAVAHRTRCLSPLRGRVTDFRRLARRARNHGLEVETYDLGGSSRTTSRLGDGRLFRLLEALSPARSRAV